MAKQSSPEMSSLAGRVLAGYWPSRDEVLALAASVLSQDEVGPVPDSDGIVRGPGGSNAVPDQPSEEG